MILSDRTLREQLEAGRIVVDPLDESLIQPSSIDVRISNLFRVFRNHSRGVIDVKQDLTDLTELLEMPESLDGHDTEAFMLHPGEFVLGSTLERVGVPDDLVGRVEGKSSDWIMGHVRAGKEVFRKEIEDAGLTLVEEVKVKGLLENYCLRFRKA